MAAGRGVQGGAHGGEGVSIDDPWTCKDKLLPCLAAHVNLDLCRDEMYMLIETKHGGKTS